MPNSNNRLLIAAIGILLLVISLLGGWILTQQNVSVFVDQEDDRPKRFAHNITESETPFDIPEGPVIVDTVLSDQPSYFYLFTHTEDPFNHELSEERYWRVGEMFESVAQEHPDLDIHWTIEFQGSDAKTINDRTADTELVEYLLALSDEELVEFGYHAHHDPTYNNRPQSDLASDASFEETYEALLSWITCEKDLLYGGCVAKNGGGADIIKDVFGEVEIVTGVGVSLGTLFERSAGSLAIRSLLPDRYLGFGLSDHGPGANNREFAEIRSEFLSILTPTHETSSSTFWMDNAIRINDDAFVEGVGTSPLKDGVKNIRLGLEAVDFTRSFVINQGIASKYLYTKEGQDSPTQWGYNHPESPELPASHLNSDAQREQLYRNTELGLNYLVDLVVSDPDHWQFVDSDGVVNLFTSEDYWNVTDDELEQLTLWLLNEWDEAPPAWVYDGEDFYSLTDAFTLLASSFGANLPTERLVSTYYGPWSLTKETTASTTIETDDLLDLIEGGLIEDFQIQETYQIDGESYTATQILYALALLYTMERQGVVHASLDIPATQTAPETYELLDAIGCTGCFDSSWSLKPARFQD